MKLSFLKTEIFSVCLLAATVLNAQNTSIGHVHGTYKDTVTTYKENPEKHSHTETAVIEKNKKAEGNKVGATPINKVSPSQVDTAPVAPADNITASTEQTVTDNNSIPINTETAQTDNCSCSTLHMAYGAAALGILGALLFLFLYLNEKNKRKESR